MRPAKPELIEALQRTPCVTAFDERALRIIAVVNGREIPLRVKSISLSSSGVTAEFDFDALAYLDAAMG